MNSFLVFTLTDKDSNITRYAVCHNFYRDYAPQSEALRGSKLQKPAKNYMKKLVMLATVWQVFNMQHMHSVETEMVKIC